MKFERVYEIEPGRIDICKKLLGGDWLYFMDDVSCGTTHLYLVDGVTYYAILPRVESVEVVLIQGENFFGIMEHVVNFARSRGIKTINGWSCKKGMHRMYQRLGAKLTNTYHEYTLEI